MEIKFKTKKLQKQYESYREATKAYGDKVAKKYIQRIGILKSAKSFDDLYQIPSLKFHPLTGNRKGEFAISLTGFYRLIITNDGDQFDIAKIEEVSKHYDD
ncbi:MAG: Plasmid maintenance system killer protein [uncultured Sulfurovum sp.]|uniref:Plasmid maintenance system killer protein n=1 Tax=uncultured Sulfurovum sp. TaxID=269237 RepID=A0A6S6T2J7_9BACT|nr:MAG: Plasmid maintenance system killer protein [uncultured Sulfurovum sp.]